MKTVFTVIVERQKTYRAEADVIAKNDREAKVLVVAAAERGDLFFVPDDDDYHIVSAESKSR